MWPKTWIRSCTQAWLNLANCFWRRRWKVKLERRMKMWTKPMPTTHNTIRTRCSWATSLTQETLDFQSINTSAQNMMIPYYWLSKKKIISFLRIGGIYIKKKQKKKPTNLSPLLKLAQWFWRRSFLNIVNAYQLSRYLPWEKEVVLHLNKSIKDALCQEG